MKKLLLAAAVATLALAGCSRESATDAQTTAPVTDAAVTVSDPWIAQPASDTSAMFGTVSNSGSETVNITGGSAPGVGMVQVHEFVSDGNTETMQEVSGGLPVPAGGSVELKPGSYHVMLMDVTQQWAVGDEVTVTLDLSNGETVEVAAPVRAREGMTQDDGMDGMDSDMMEASPSAS